MANQRKRISELPPLDVASLDTTFVLGISGSTTYKISINNLTSSLDGAFATDLVTTALSSSLDSKLSISSFNQYTTSFTASVANGTISGSSQLTSSFDERYVVSGSITQTTWDNIANKPNDIVSSSTQISDLGFVTGSYTTINSFNSLTQSFNSISQSFTTISGSVGTIDFSGINAVTASYLAFTQSYYNASASFDNRIDGLENATSSYLTSLNGAISSSEQVLGGSGVYSSSAQIQGNIYSAGSSFTFQDLLIGAGTTFGKITTDGSKYISVMPTYNVESARFWTNGNVTIQDGGDYVDNGFRLEVSGSTRIVGSFNATNGITGSTNFNTIINKPTLISGSSQLTSSYDTRYTLSGSVQPLPSNLVSSSAQITAFGFVSSSTTIPAGTISGSSQLTSSFDSRYVLESETGSLQTSITNLNSFTQSFSTSVDSRFDTLEATIISGSPNYTQVLGNRRTNITTTGVSLISGSITTTGNPVQIMVTGDANPVNVVSWTRLQIYRNETAIGNIVQVENSSNLNVPYCLNVIDTPSAGTYSYSMRTVSGITGVFDFGESSGPTLTAVELKTNTNLPSTNNIFTGTNTFNGEVNLNNSVKIGPGGGSEGGELALAYAPSGNTLTGTAVSVDVYENRLRIFEGGGNSRGVYVDLSKAPNGVGGELLYKASGFVNEGVDVTLGNLKARLANSGNRSLQLSTVSGTYSVYGSSVYSYNGVGAVTLNNGTPLNVTTTPAYLSPGYNFIVAGATDTWNIMDTSAGIAWRITMIIGAGYLNNFISIERL